LEILDNRRGKNRAGENTGENIKTSANGVLIESAQNF
jgi:hypothetical protein